MLQNNDGFKSYPTLKWIQTTTGLSHTRRWNGSKQRQVYDNVCRWFDVYDDCCWLHTDVVFSHYKDGCRVTVVVVVDIQRHLEQRRWWARRRNLISTDVEAPFCSSVSSLHLFFLCLYIQNYGTVYSFGLLDRTTDDQFLTLSLSMIMYSRLRGAIYSLDFLYCRILL